MWRAMSEAPTVASSNNTLHVFANCISLLTNSRLTKQWWLPAPEECRRSWGWEVQAGEQTPLSLGNGDHQQGAGVGTHSLTFSQLRGHEDCNKLLCCVRWLGDRLSAAFLQAPPFHLYKAHKKTVCNWHLFRDEVYHLFLAWIMTHIRDLRKKLPFKKLPFKK